MKIQVRYFAALREALGPGETIDLPERATVAGLQQLLAARGETHASALAPGRAIRAAMNHAMCPDSTELQDGCEIAFFPPVTGG